MCDTIAALGKATTGGVVLFGKNSDREWDEAQHLELIPSARHGQRVRLTYKEIDQVPHTYTVLLSKPHWIWGAEIGANSHGLVIGNEAIFSKIAASSADGIIGMDYLRLALERAKDVEEAITVITTLLREHGQGGNCGYKRDLAYHNSFILADPRCVKVLETVDREWVVRSIHDYYAISNVMTIGAEYERSSPTLASRAGEAGLYERGNPLVFNAAFQDERHIASGTHRRARATDLLSAKCGNLQAADMFHILRDHKEGSRPADRSSGPRICAHSPENALGQTTASWVTSLTSDKIVHWVTGTAAPCTGLFKPLVLDCGVPSHGPVPRAEADTASLWWRHEQLRKLLEEAIQSDRVAFTQERDSLEAAFVRNLTECPAPVDDQSRAEVCGVIELCWHEGLEFESKWYERLSRPGK